MRFTWKRHICSYFSVKFHLISTFLFLNLWPLSRNFVSAEYEAIQPLTSWVCLVYEGREDNEVIEHGILSSRWCRHHIHQTLAGLMVDSELKREYEWKVFFDQNLDCDSVKQEMCPLWSKCTMNHVDQFTCSCKSLKESSIVPFEHFLCRYQTICPLVLVSLCVLICLVCRLIYKCCHSRCCRSLSHSTSHSQKPESAESANAANSNKLLHSGSLSHSKRHVGMDSNFDLSLMRETSWQQCWREARPQPNLNFNTLSEEGPTISPFLSDSHRMESTFGTLTPLSPRLAARRRNLPSPPRRSATVDCLNDLEDYHYEKAVEEGLMYSYLGDTGISRTKFSSRKSISPGTLYSLESTHTPNSGEKPSFRFAKSDHYVL